MRKPFAYLSLPILLLLFQPLAYGQDTLKQEPPTISHGKNGFEFQTADRRFLLQFQSRLQFRFATPGDQNPLTLDDFHAGHKRVYKINRARLKIGGHAYKPWLKYYWEYELSQGNLLDFRVMVERWDFLKLKIGQWKTYYNRERIISSGQQQMVDRSILTRPFTLDRQQGIELYGRLFEGKLYDFTYHLSSLTGNGRGAATNDDSHVMYVGRLQWNMFGRELGMTASDLDYHEEMIGLIAFSGMTNRSPYTRFSQAGGGQLEGFDPGEAGQYRINQWLIESAFMWKGFSWQQEYHHKEVNDLINNQITTLTGNYVQAGYFFANTWDWFPRPLEVAARYAFFRPDIDIRENLQEEYGLAFNWFFAGHLNKLTAEISYFQLQDEALNQAEGTRFRLQWDISL